MSFDSTMKRQFWPAAGQLFARLFILLGLPLLAWGLADLAGFFANPARAAFAAAVVVQASIYAWLRYQMPPMPDREPHLDWARWHAVLFETIFILAAFGDRRGIMTWPDVQPLRWLGLGIYVLGACLAIWSGATWTRHQRRQGSGAVAEPVLLVDGPYRWIRFPYLLALALYSLGAAILFRSWVGLALMLPLIAAIVYRIHLLETLYADTYRKEWPIRSYRSRRLIPFVY